MAASSFHHRKPYPWISTSLSMNSLDLGPLLSNSTQTVQKSLLSESLTLDSISSKTSDVPPTFPSRNLPTVRTIGLGDRLKMFSSGMRQRSEDPGKEVNSTVLISAPTIPRLKSMLKECLSIAKWVKTSAGWHAPGHIPWEGIHETITEQWVPEGSLFSPECFVLALARSRTTVDQTRSCLERQSSEVPSPIHEPKDDFQTEDLMQAELLDMMRQLKNIRTFFQSPVQNNQSSQVKEASQHFLQSQNPALPYLVVSNSQFTFPITLESSHSISGCDSSSLATRRGKRTPPHLRLKGDTPGLPYSEIPTFCPALPSPQFECKNSENKPSMHLEDMINNLRLRCSTMAPQAPPPDASWNSRPGSVLTSELISSDGSHNHAELVEGYKRVLARSLLPEAERHPHLQQRATTFKYTHLPRSSSLQRAIRGKRRSAHIIVTDEVDSVRVMGPIKNAVGRCESDTRDNLDLYLQRACTTSSELPSAMARKRISGASKSPKSVRFMFSHQEVEEEGACPITPKEDPNVNLGRIKSTLDFFPANPRMVSTHTRQKGISLARSTSSIASWKKTRSVNVSPALRLSVASKTSLEFDTGVKPNTSDLSALRRSTQSLGRQSLNRIIKGPMFSGRVSKRATIISTSTTGSISAENSVRSGVTLTSVRKKSRVPVPLQNILTRFK